MNTNARVDQGHLAEWTGEAWRSEVEEWIGTVLAVEGRRLSGSIKQPRVRPWSTQLTVPTDGGLWWFKENAGALSYEAAVVQRLAELAPDHVVPPIAIDPDRGRMLSVDQGPTLVEVGEATADTWLRILAEFGQLQRALVGHRDSLVAAGLPELTPEQLPIWAVTFAEELGRLPEGDPRRLTAAEVAAVVRAAETRAEDVALLASGLVPFSLDHNDLHGNNAFVPAEGRPLRFFDFGDALWGHPFTCLHVPLSILGSGDNPYAEPSIRGLQDAYLEIWADLAPLAELRELLAAALRLAPVHRAHAWWRVMESAPAEDLGEYADAAAYWLRTWAACPTGDA